MTNSLEWLLHYGEKRRHNLIIEIAGFESLLEKTKKNIKDKIEDYKGNFIVTYKGYLLRGHDTDLSETRCGVLNLNESENEEGLLNLINVRFFQNLLTHRVRTIRYKERDRIHIHYCVDNPPVIIGTDYIVRDWKGLRIEEYIPVLRREPIIKMRVGERELVPHFNLA